MKKTIYLSCGFISFSLGIIGSFLPIVPTTPFILLAAFFFSKSSDRWYQWLISLPRFGKSIQDYNEYNVISIKAKITCFISITSVIGYFCFLTEHIMEFKIGLTIILIVVLSYVLTRPSIKP